MTQEQRAKRKKEKRRRKKRDTEQRGDETLSTTTQKKATNGGSIAMTGLIATVEAKLLRGGGGGGELNRKKNRKDKGLARSSHPVKTAPNSPYNSQGGRAKSPFSSDTVEYNIRLRHQSPRTTTSLRPPLHLPDRAARKSQYISEEVAYAPEKTHTMHQNSKLQRTNERTKKKKKKITQYGVFHFRGSEGGSGCFGDNSCTVQVKVREMFRCFFCSLSSYFFFFNFYLFYFM